MKKQYMTPETLLHHLQLQQIIAASKPFQTNSDGDIIGGTLQDEDAGGPAMGRRRRNNDWEDDWEDEEDY